MQFNTYHIKQTEAYLSLAVALSLHVGYVNNREYTFTHRHDCDGSSYLCTFCSEVPHDLCPLSVCSLSLPHSLHLNPVSGVGLEGGQSVGGVTVSRLGDSDGSILKWNGVGHSEGVALGVDS